MLISIFSRQVALDKTACMSTVEARMCVQYIVFRLISCLTNRSSACYLLKALKTGLLWWHSFNCAIVPSLSLSMEFEYNWRI